jgi:hypothetical protein
VDSHGQLTLCVDALCHSHAHVTAAHVGDDGHAFTALTIEQGDFITGLHSANLHVSRSACRQIQFVTQQEGSRAMKAG